MSSARGFYRTHVIIIVVFCFVRNVEPSFFVLFQIASQRVVKGLLKSLSVACVARCLLHSVVCCYGYFCRTFQGGNTVPGSLNNDTVQALIRERRATHRFGCRQTSLLVHPCSKAARARAYVCGTVRKRSCAITRDVMPNTSIRITQRQGDPGEGQTTAGLMLRNECWKRHCVIAAES